MIDPNSAEFIKNPYRSYAQLRALEKPHYFADYDMWFLSRYTDVTQIALDPTCVRSLRGYRSEAELIERQKQANWHDIPYHARFVQSNLLDSDGPAHHRLRQQVFGVFTARNLARLEPMIQSYIDRCMDAVSGQGKFDFIGSIAAKVPVYVICQFVGVSVDDIGHINRWSVAIVEFFDMGRDPEKKLKAEAATKDFAHYVMDLCKARAAQPRDDLISKLVQDEAAGHFKGDECVATIMLILMAGQGSTTDVLGTGLHTLLRQPESLSVLREDPACWPGAIEEMFRYEAPLPFFHRHATEDIILRGHHFPAGTTFGLLYGAANRDPVHFDKADDFIIERTPNRHLAFGHGAHLCLGNHLARLNIRLIFSTLFRTYSRLSLGSDDVAYKPGLSVRGPQTLWVQGIRV